MTNLTYEASSDQETGFQLTIADGALLLIGAIAAVLRLVNLGRPPLSPAEAEAALTVWQFWLPGQADLVIGSPAYFTLTGLLTQVLGFSDWVMRLVPALFGVGLVLLPWLLRKQLGEAGMLATAVFLTISPITSAIARTAGGDSIALFAALLLLAAWVRLQIDGNGRWRYALLIALALGLTSAPLFYSALLTLAAAWLLLRLFGPHFSEEKVELGETAVWRTPALVAGTLFLALTTTFLLNLSGFGAAFALFSDWLGQFGRDAMVAWSAPLLAIGRYEPGLLLIGLFAIVWAVWRGHALAGLSVYWLLALLVLLLAQQGVMANAGLVSVAAALLLGSFAGMIIGERIEPHGWALGGGLLVMWAVIFVNFARYARVSLFRPEDLSYVWVALFGLTLGLTAVYFLITWEPRATYQGLLLSLLAFLIFYSWGAAWRLSHLAANDPRETWVTTGATDDLPLMIATLKELSWQMARSEHDLDVHSTVNSPLLGWYLREFRNLTISDGLPPAATNSVIITPFTAEPALGSDYIGTDFGLWRSGATPGFSQLPIMDTLRWWLFGQTNSQIQEERVIIWLRADLVAGGQ
jgi:hypothetical protein